MWADVEDFDSVFDSGGNAAWHLALRRNDVAHGAAEEHVAGLGLEDQVGNDARVGAGDEEDVGLLAVGEKVKLILPLREDVAAEAGIALEETFHQGSVYGRLRNSKAGQRKSLAADRTFSRIAALAACERFLWPRPWLKKSRRKRALCPRFAGPA